MNIKWPTSQNSLEEALSPHPKIPSAATGFVECSLSFFYDLLLLVGMLV